jgi:hypothetical protein
MCRGEGAHPAVQRPSVLPRRRARRVPCLAAQPGLAGARHVARVRRLLRQGLRRHLGAGGDAEEDQQQGPIRHPRHRRGNKTCPFHFQYGGARLMTDGDKRELFRQVWDVLSNEEAVQIVAGTPDREKAAKRLVECAVRAWRRRRRGIAVDDCSAICLFFHSPPS